MATTTQAPPARAGSSPALDSIVAHSKTLLIVALRVADTLGPIIATVVVAIHRFCVWFKPYAESGWGPLLFGILLIGYGGTWPTVLAAVESFRICGWDNTKRSIVTLYKQFMVASEASAKDDQLDEDGNGIPDVLEVSKHQLVTRKVSLFLRSTDPEALQQGIQGLTAGCSAVVATLRLQFAHTLTLGVALGDIFTRTADTVLRRPLEKVTPPPYQKWIGIGISYGCRSLAVSIAWWCARVISAMHSATRGAQLVLYGLTLLASRFHLHVPLDVTTSNPLYPIVCGAVGGFGLYCQLTRGFSLPFPFNILLFPLTLLDWLLYYFLSTTTV